MKKQQKKQLKQIENQAQQGRSMVEMLGVLAIIGVLSIGGIAGYRWGMDKHVSNQILNEMNLNSLQLAMLLQKGNPDGVTLSLGSPYDDENPTFRTVNYGFQYGCGENAEVADPECEYINETRYFITALDLPERVQKMVAESAENLQYATAVETDETDGFVTVFFDVDAGVTEYESRPEEPETSEHIYTPEVTEPTTTTTTVTTTPETTTEATTTTESTTTVTTTTITTTTQPKSCEDLHCGADEFCLSSGCSYVCSNGQMPEEDSCKNGTYKCEKIDSYKAENKDTEHPGKYVMSKSIMSWWSAERFCKAQHKHMVSATELKCKDKLGEDFGYGKSNTWCYCHNDESKKTCMESSSSDVSSVIKELRKAEKGTDTSGINTYWLDNAYANTTPSRNSCSAYSVFLSNGGVQNHRRNDLDFALCE